MKHPRHGLNTMKNTSVTQPIADEDIKTASTNIIVATAQLCGIVLLIAFLCFAKSIKAWLRLKSEEGGEKADNPPPYQPPPSFTAAMKMFQEFNHSESPRS